MTVKLRQSDLHEIMAVFYSHNSRAILKSSTQMYYTHIHTQTSILLKASTVYLYVLVRVDIVTQTEQNRKITNK